MSRKIISFCILLVFVTTASAQQLHYFDKGLMVSGIGRYGREAIYTDLLAYQLYTNTLKTPVDGGSLGLNERNEQLIWQAITADSAHRLFNRNLGRGFGVRGGYIYLTYTSDKGKPALLNIQGANNFYFNGEPHTADPYGSGWLYIPVQLKQGLNELYVRGSFVTAFLQLVDKPVLLNTEDATLPHVITGAENSSMQGAIVVINSSPKLLQGLQLKSIVNGEEIMNRLPPIQPMSTRKVSFWFNAQSIKTKGKYECRLILINKNSVLDETKINLEAVAPTEKHSNTFVSNIDGSLQYYAVAPQIDPKKGSALFLSVHGAGVEAIGQARAYQSKDWGTLVAATNRRPRGFNWEDWGRIDALEVLHLAKEKFHPDPQRIYLTGHSMGGHGTWFLGATYPDKWAAIAPCAGYPTLKGYGSADGLIPDSANSMIEKMLLRSSNQSDVPKLAGNYKPLGVYIFHGDSDRVVSVNYARQMRKLLGEFHTDLSYYEYPGGEHWFGDHSVDWKPIFDFFKWHTIAADSAVNTIDFVTSNPGISSTYRWAAIQQQVYPLQYSRLQLNRNRKEKTITGNTENIRLLKFHLNDFNANTSVKISLDGEEAVLYTTTSAQDSLFLLRDGSKWIISSPPSFAEKGPHRYGTFKDAFNHRMIFVYGTRGTKEENEWSANKARYDAETWYYRGNGAVDVITDKEFTLSKYRDRGIILYGNKNTNAAWKSLLNDCPIQVERNKITAGEKQWVGDDLAAYFVWPVRNSKIASVGVISGSGIKGMKAANANQYFAGASGFPDFMIYRLNMLVSGAGEVKLAGFFDNSWKLDDSNLVEVKDNF